jgi:hypothetical protein
MNAKSPKSQTVKFFSQSNLFIGLIGLVTLVGALAPVYQSNVEAARQIELLRIENEQERRENTQIEQELDKTQVSVAKTHASLAEAKVAIKAVYDPSFVRIKHYCSRFGRQVELKSQNGRFQKYFGATAKITGNNFLKSPYGHRWPQDKAKLGGKLQPGDFLIKRSGSGGAGHFGVYVGPVPAFPKYGNLVAENSSTAIRRVQGAKGFRTLEEFNAYGGKFDVVVRLPDPVKK